MKSKLKNIAMISFLAIAGIFGISSTLINQNINETPVVEKAEAAAPSYVFFQADHWDAGGAWFALYVWGGTGGAKWFGMTKVPGSTSTYSVGLGSYTDSTGCIFYRMDKDKHDLSEDSMWNKTQDISLSSNNNYFVIESGGWTGAGGTWSNKTIDDVYMPGSHNGWVFNNDSKMSITSQVSGYSKTFYLQTALNKDVTFKFSNNNWGGWEIGSDTTDSNTTTIGGKEGNNNLGGSGGNILVNTKGFYTFTITVYVGGTWTAENVTYYPSTVTITYRDKGDNPCSGSTTGLPTTHTNGSTTSLSNPGSRTGYTFSGWFTSSDCSGSAVTSITDLKTDNFKLYALWTGNNYTVTFNKNSGTGGSNSVSATYGSAMPSATAPTRTGYHFDGYWDGSGGTGTQYYSSNMSSVTNWNKTSATTLYAKWDLIRTIYYVSSATTKEATPDFIYSWSDHGSNQFGSFPGTAIASIGVDVTGVVQFEGSYKHIYKISIWNDNFKFSWGGGTDAGGGETGDKTVTNGAAYWWDGGANTDAGAALDLIFAEEVARNAVTAHGSIKNFSICGISQSTASSLYTTYSTGLTTEAKRLVDTSTTKTYIGTSSTEGQVSFTDIFNQLSRIGSGVYSNAIRNFSPFNLFGDDAENGYSTLIIIISSSVALLSVTALSILVIKKRKHKEN